MTKQAVRTIYRRIMPEGLRQRIWDFRQRARTRLRHARAELPDRLLAFRYGLRARRMRIPEGYPVATWSIETNGRNAMRRAWIRSVVRGSVLDVGCGHGFVTCDMAAVADHVTAIDISPDHLRHAVAMAQVNQIRNVAFATGDCYSLPFGEGQFETVTLLEVLEHLEDPAAAVREALRVAARRVVITVPAHGWMTDTPGHINDFTATDLESMLPDKPFVVVREPFTFLLYEIPRERFSTIVP